MRAIAASVLLLVAGADAAIGQATGTLDATAKVTPATVVTGTDLDFGWVAPTQTKVVAPASGGQFFISVQGHRPVDIAYSVPATLGPNLSLGSWIALLNFTNDPASATQIVLAAPNGNLNNVSTPTGSIYLWLGATLSTTNAAPGSYSAPVTLTVSYF